MRIYFTYVLLLYTNYVTIFPHPEKRNFFRPIIHYSKEIRVSKIIKKARPVVEATLISMVLVTIALSVPAAIVFTAI